MAQLQLQPNERPSEELVALATELALADERMRYALIEARRDLGLSQRDVARLLGITQASVAAFERYDNDPRLSTIRRYALAVGAAIEHTVRPAEEFLSASSVVATAQATATSRVTVSWQVPAEARGRATHAPFDWTPSVSAVAANSNSTDFGLAA